MLGRSRAILEELRPLFPRIEQIEEVSLSRIFQLNDSEKEVSELFRQVHLTVLEAFWEERLSLPG